MRAELASVSEGVLSQLPEREQLAKSMRRQRRANLPPNPKSLSDLASVPERFQQTLAGEKFLLFDTRRNLEFLARSSTWFLDGTFRVIVVIINSSSIFIGVIIFN